MTTDLNPREGGDISVATSREKTALEKLVTALRTSSRCLRRDHRGELRIRGRFGSITTNISAVYVHVHCDEPSRWRAVKKDLRFCTVIDDGAQGGVLRLDGEITPDQAAALRKCIGLKNG